MKIKRALLLYKTSSYKNYFILHKKEIAERGMRFTALEVAVLKASHDKHYETLKFIEKCLRAIKIPYEKFQRGSQINYSRYDFIITVGGDGTFLEAARGAKSQILLGVNSNPGESTGRFCIASPKSFKNILKKILSGKILIKKVYRLGLWLNGSSKPFSALNDCLISHINPAGLSRYQLSIGKRSEEHRSSGLWISTAAGSTGATYSAKGKIIPVDKKVVQYVARELKVWPNAKYRLRGGILEGGSTLKVRSLMRSGMIYIDGAHRYLPFSVGHTARISLLKNPLKVIL